MLEPVNTIERGDWCLDHGDRADRNGPVRERADNRLARIEPDRRDAIRDIHRGVGPTPRAHRFVNENPAAFAVVSVTT